MRPDLLAQIPAKEPIASVSADGAYDTRDCLDAIARRSAQGVIPPRKNTSIWMREIPGSAHRKEAEQVCKRFGWRIWQV